MIRSTVLTSLIFSTLCHADFAGMYVDADPNYVLGQTTYRIFAVFDNPEDRVFGISGDTGENAPSLSFSSTAGLVQSCNTGFELFCDSDFSGSAATICTVGSLLNTQGVNAPNDTFLCVVGFNDSEDVPLVGDDLTPYVNPGLGFSPDVFCNAPTPLPIEGSSWSTAGTEGGGTITFPPDSDSLPGETGPLVWIAQFTLPSDESFTFTGQVSYSRNIFPGVPGILEDEPFIVLSSDASIYKGSSCSNAKSFLAALQARLKDFEPGELLDACDDGLLDFCQGIDVADIQSTDCNSNGIVDYCDPDFEDLNNNGLADICEDIDCDDDGIPDPIEIEKGAPDTNQNGIPDECEPDCDGDGILDEIEIQEGSAIDLNGNGIDDECDPDCDQNGVPDFFQIEQGAFDCNLDGILDSCEISEDPALDLNNNTVIDPCEADCNENGSFDFVDLFLGISQDINKNSVPDECEDCDGDGIPDDLEDKADCDGNGLPDDCEVDEDCDSDGEINACDFDDDGDGIEDLCDADSCGITGQDCDENGILDSCEEFSDCNNNGIDDRCDIQSGEEDDLNLDGTPDSCQCIADVVPSGAVGFSDLVTLLSAWGTCDTPCPSDIIADGDVGFSDLLYLLSNWGPCSG